MACGCSTSGHPPARWVQGDLVVWETSAPDYPVADGWTLTTVFRAAGAAAVAVDGVPTAETTYRFTLGVTETAALPAGVVAWQMGVELGATKRTIAAGRSLSCPNIGLAGADFDPTTPAERMLAALLAIGPTIMASGYATMAVDGMTVEFRSLDEYNRALAIARDQVAAEQARLGPCETAGGNGATGNRRRVLVRFTPA